MKKHLLGLAAVAAAGLFTATGAQAQVAGQMLVKLGWNKIMPKVRSDELSAPSLPGSTIDIHSASALLFTATYMFTDNISMELLAGLPYKHSIYGTGAVAGAGKIGTIHQISPTLMLQYRFLEANAPLRPYLGAGITYAHFYDTEGSPALTAVTDPGGPGTTIGGDTSWGGTIQAGVNYKIDSHWFLDAGVLKTFIDTDAQLSSGQTIHAKLNPVSVQFSVGYTF